MTRKLSKEEIKEKLEGNELDLSLCNLVKVPVRELDTFCTLKHLIRLDLSKNALTELPEEFGLLDQLQRLDLYSNNLSALPTSCSELTKLRWLDLKNNPIQTLLPDVVGDCLKAEDCKMCAQRMLSYLKADAANKEREFQASLMEERKRKEDLEMEIRQEKELRRRLKQQERQQKREAYEAMERQKKLMAMEMDRDLKSQEEFMETRPQPEPQSNDEDDGGILGILLVMAVVTLVIAVGIVFFCYHDNTCKELLISFSS